MASWASWSGAFAQRHLPRRRNAQYTRVLLRLRAHPELREAYEGARELRYAIADLAVTWPIAPARWAG